MLRNELYAMDAFAYELHSFGQLCATQNVTKTDRSIFLVLDAVSQCVIIDCNHIKDSSMHYSEAFRVGASSSCPLSNQCHLVIIIIPGQMCQETTDLRCRL